MKIQKLLLNNYRNFNNIEFYPEENINYIYGLNGVGKTNLIESLSYLSLGKSYKGIQDKILVKNGQDFFYIKAETTDNSSFEVGVNNKTKVRKHNGIEIKKASDYVGLLKSVIFSTDDLLLIRGTPQDKRKFLDILLSQVDNRYLVYAVTVKQLIEQKNIELKKDYPNRDYLLSINEQLFPLLQYIQEKRNHFIEYLNNCMTDIYQYVSEQNKNISIKYYSNIKESFNFNEVIEEEINRKNAYYGIHRDTFKIYLDGLDADDYASQGQQRLLILCLKILQVQYIVQETKEIPIFILDDVFSELDKQKIKRFLLYIKDISCQTFITSTEYLEKEDFISYFCLSADNVIKKET